MIRSRLIFIVGPTASGKTELALREAERFGGPILSCDSLCVYEGMDIGTAKPTREEQARVAHFGIDLAKPDQAYSVARYVAYRDRILKEHQTSGVPIVVVGGSGFYLKSFFSAVTDRVSIPLETQQRVARIREAGGMEALRRELEALHQPVETFPGLDFNNPRRVEKALGRCLASGRSYSELKADFLSQPEPLREWEKEVCLVVRRQEDLQERNRKRVFRMLEEGLIGEVRRLRLLGLERNPSAAGAIGYREALAYLDGLMGEEELASSIITHTNQLMRKQRTWFRHNLSVDREILL